MKRRVFPFAVALLAFTSAAPASAQFDITFDGMLPGTALDGLTIQGVTFGYTSTSVNDFDVATGPGCLTFVCDPVGEGGTENGLLTMSFGSPLNVFSFGLASSVEGEASVLVTPYSVFGAALGSTVVDLSTLTTFVEGLYTYSGSAALGSVAIDLDYDERIGAAFAIDNIRGEVVPEPMSLILLGTGLIGLVGVARRRGRSTQVG